jgi:O-antigen ligase
MSQSDDLARETRSISDAPDRPEGSRSNRARRSQRKRRSKPATNRIAFWILSIAIAGAPLPFGSRDAITVALWCALLGAGLIIVSPRHLRRPHVWMLAGIGVIVLAFAFVLHEQLAVHPWVAQPNPIWAQTSELLHRQIVPSVSVVRGEPFYALGASLSAVLALVLGLVVGAERARARQALSVMAWSGAAYAVYAITFRVLEPNMILWREKTSSLGALTGTFINPNTAATYFGSAAAVWFVLLMASVRGHMPRGPIVWRKALDHILTDTPTEIPQRFAMLFVCLTALVMTGSRAGVLVSLLALLISFAAYFRRDLPRGKNLVVAVLAAGAVALLVMGVIGGKVNEKIDAEGLFDMGRWETYRSTLRLIADHPWFGTGLGTFAWAFPPYRSADISTYGVWDLAHSTPLELAADVGVPLTIAIALAWLAALAILAWALRGSRRKAVVPLAALAVALIGLLHSSVDFSLQVTGYAIVMFAVVGVGLGQSFSQADERQGALPSQSNAPPYP